MTSTGPLTLSGANTYSGGTTITAGTLSITADSALGAGSAPRADSITLNGGTIATMGNITLSTNRDITLGTGGGTLDKIKATGGGNLTSSGLIAGSGSLNKADTGTLSLSGVNTYGGTIVVSGGTVPISSDSVLGATSLITSGAATFSSTWGNTATFNLNTNRGITLGANGTLDVAPRPTQTFAGLIGGNLSLKRADDNEAQAHATGSATTSSNALITRGLARTLGTSGGTIDVASDTGTTQFYGGLIAGGGNLTKTGTGTLSLSGLNTYTGGTTVSSGVLTPTGASSISLSSGTRQVLTAVAGSSAFSTASGRTAYAVVDEGVKAKMNVRESTPGSLPNLVTTGTVLGSVTHTNGAAADRLNLNDATAKFDATNQPVEGTVNLYYVPGTTAPAAPAAAAAPPSQNREYVPVTKAAISRMTGASAPSGSPEEAAALKEFLQKAGVDFDGVAGAGLAYNGSTIAVTQTPKNLDKIRNILARYNDIKQVTISTEFVEVAQDNQAAAVVKPTPAQQVENAKREAAATAAAERARTQAEIAGAEIKTTDETFSTFSLHVGDVSFKLALAALAKGEKPDPAGIRPEEFYNAFDYGDPSPVNGEPVACRIEQSAHPVLQQRNLVRIALRVPATGRDAAQPLRLTVLLDTSGSMERADRAACVHAALASLASLLGPNDVVTLIGFARTPRLLAQQLPGGQAAKLLALTANLPFEGGTNLEEALKLAGEEARRQQLAGAQNRIVLLTDGAANLGDADPEQLAKQIVALRQQGITIDACGVVASGLDDGILEALTRKGDGRYYLLNAPEDADAGFARQLAGAFHPAAENVKVQVHFNPARVASYRLVGFEANRLKTEDFHNDAVTAAQLASEEAAVALYQVEVLPQGDGEIGRRVGAVPRDRHRQHGRAHLDDPGRSVGQGL